MLCKRRQKVRADRSVGKLSTTLRIGRLHLGCHQKRPFVLYELLIMQDLTSDETHNGNQLQASKQPRNYLAVACLLAYQLLDRRLAAGALRSYHKSDGCCDLRAYRQVLRLRTYAIPIEDEVRAPCRLPRGDGANGEIASTLFGLCFLLGDHETRNSNVPPTHGARATAGRLGYYVATHSITMPCVCCVARPTSYLWHHRPPDARSGQTWERASHQWREPSHQS